METISVLNYSSSTLWQPSSAFPDHYIFVYQLTCFSEIILLFILLHKYKTYTVS